LACSIAEIVDLSEDCILATYNPEVDSRILAAPGFAEVLDRANARHDQIEPLRTVPGHWVNRFGYQNTGYVTYPRHYVSGSKYPAIVVTHGTDAGNKFLQDALQWEFPIQVFAERGYFVLSVNEPARHSDDPNTHIPTESRAVSRERSFSFYWFQVSQLTVSLRDCRNSYPVGAFVNDRSNRML
jgi:hypothetical protein